ncbi:MAG: tol-pal system protein YbgF [Candidatus Tectomicrobia bacterium]|uniref:Tol-pal system protein YbgF n=1 Tax=Tectimicrobiota bacterium TaxID=2528274 RepID=A0A933GK38_UNCTE|nr:tol-pal system protein YbgF [Candidatus Tectomicrobia bacterium]
MIMNRWGKLSRSSRIVTLVVITLLAGCTLSNQDVLIMQEDLSKIKRQLTALEDTVNRKLPLSSTSILPKAEQNLMQEVKITQKNQADAKIKLDELGDNVQMVRSKIDELNYQMNGVNQKLDNLDMRLSSGQGTGRLSGVPGSGYPPSGMTSQLPEQSSQNVPSIGTLGSQSGIATQPLTGGSPGTSGSLPSTPPSQEFSPGGQGQGGPFKSGQLPASGSLPPTQEQTPGSTTSAPSQPGMQVAGIPPQQIYQTAYQDYVNKNYELSILGFREFLARNPKSPLADNAQYWIGESYYSLNKFNEAIVEFNRVIENYPNSSKKYASLLKKGYSLIEIKRTDEGTRELQNLIRLYPQTEEAKLAEAKLKSIRSR